jgi:hypothetical protein
MGEGGSAALVRQLLQYHGTDATNSGHLICSLFGKNGALQYPLYRRRQPARESSFVSRASNVAVKVISASRISITDTPAVPPM